MEEIETLQAFRSAGADLNEMDYDKRTALHVVSSTDIVILPTGKQRTGINVCVHERLDLGMCTQHYEVT